MLLAGMRSFDCVRQTPVSAQDDNSYKLSTLGYHPFVAAISYPPLTGFPAAKIAVYAYV
jgi:hypothetical protein